MAEITPQQTIEYGTPTFIILKKLYILMIITEYFKLNKNW